ncbi:MAG TPA: hypothetical protein VK698_18305 [Kofleriaceae bacterium]|nr:hypothetical protein [Kofleriaceae bacterium]
MKTFKSFRDKADTTTPDNSRVAYSLNGGLATHPVKTTDGTIEQAVADKLLAFITAANVACVADGGCAPVTGGVDYFDYAVYQSTIQPALDAAGAGIGCSSSAACHAGPVGQLGVILNPAPAADSAEMAANYEMVKSKISLDGDPKTSLLYVQATIKHGGGVSTTIDAAGATALEGFIQAAIDARGAVDPGTGSGGCANPALLDVGVFEDEILPILNGEIDLNDQNNEGTATGCTRQTCHGVARPGALTLIPTDPIETQLANFACFVNLASPSSSPVLLCPSKSPACPKNPHPGDRIFDGADDNNYERILSYLFSANSDNIPIDFAFYARRINPIFDNRNAVEDGAQGRTCADTNACHGIQVATQAPPNGSNFGLLPDAGENVARLKANFTEAASMINFNTPDGSSLFLYPTNEINNVDGNEFATGTIHPGGADFAIDSAFALDILKFAEGLRPDGDGNQLNWLIAGAFQGANDIDDDTLVDEDNVLPEVFQQAGGDELAGKWDAFFSDDALVDVGAFLTGDAGSGRIAFATSYLINTTTVDQRVEVELTPVNDARLYVGGAVTDVTAGNTASLTVTIPASRATDTPQGNRIFIKLFQAADEADLAFTVRLLRADNNQPFNDVGGELVLKLGPQGGI